MVYEEKEYLGIRYAVWKPQDFCDNKTYSVIFYTHGAGGRGDDIQLLEQDNILIDIISSETNAVVIAPQCSQNTWFDVFEKLIELAKNTYELPYVDKARFYGVGASMGGYAMLQLMQSQPDLFTAGIICCGGGMYWNADRLKNIKLRLFHGQMDNVVYPEESIRMCEKINSTGGNAQLTIFPDCDHNCWDKTFTNEENIKWLLSCKK